jgi:hypothetical protein
MSKTALFIIALIFICCGFSSSYNDLTFEVMQLTSKVRNLEFRIDDLELQIMSLRN